MKLCYFGISMCLQCSSNGQKTAKQPWRSKTRQNRNMLGFTIKSFLLTNRSFVHTCSTQHRWCPTCPPQLLCVRIWSPAHFTPLTGWLGDKLIKRKTLFKGESRDLDDTRTQSIVTLFNPVEIICDFTCADTLVLIHVCLFSPLICRISGLAVWIFPQCRSKVAASLFLFYCFWLKLICQNKVCCSISAADTPSCLGNKYSYTRELISLIYQTHLNINWECLKKQHTTFRDMIDKTMYKLVEYSNQCNANTG